MESKINPALPAMDALRSVTAPATVRAITSPPMAVTAKSAFSIKKARPSAAVAIALPSVSPNSRAAS